jgi:hypothetical protein
LGVFSPFEPGGTRGAGRAVLVDKGRELFKMGGRGTLLLLAVFVALVAEADSIQFDLPSGKVKCFSEDIPEHTLVVGDYNAERLPEGQNRMPIEVQVSDPMEKVLYSQDDIEKGRFAFTSTVAGDYIVCFHNKGLSEFQTQRRATLDLKHGIDAKDYTNVMKSDHLTEVQWLLEQLQHRSAIIMDDFVNHKYREEKLRDNTEAACSRVVWFAIFTMCVVIATGIVQSMYLQSFFKRKKLI